MATIQQSLIEVMKEVGAVGKNDRNTSQGFAFRGIDAVINAVSPAFQKHGVIVVPTVVDKETSMIESAKGKAMTHVQLKVAYTFYGNEGDFISATVYSEAMDYGDKATAKAMSVALRTALLQTLALPTDEPDPDSQSYERGAETVSNPVRTKAPVESKPASAEQIAMATEALAQVADIEDMEELKNFYKGAQDAGLLYINIMGENLNTAIGAKKKELEGK